MPKQATGQVDLTQRRGRNAQLAALRGISQARRSPPRSRGIRPSAAELATLLHAPVIPTLSRPLPVEVVQTFARAATLAGILPAPNLEGLEPSVAEIRRTAYFGAAEQLLRAALFRDAGAYAAAALWANPALAHLYSFSLGLFSQKVSALVPREMTPGQVLTRLAELGWVGGEDGLQEFHNQAVIGPRLSDISSATHHHLSQVSSPTYDIGVLGALGAFGSEVLQAIRQLLPAVSTLGIDQADQSGNFAKVGRAFRVNSGSYPPGEDPPAFGAQRELSGTRGPFFLSDTGPGLYPEAVDRGHIAEANAAHAAATSGALMDTPADLLLGTAAIKVELQPPGELWPAEVRVTLDNGEQIYFPTFVIASGTPEDNLPFVDNPAARERLDRLLTESTDANPRVQTARTAMERIARLADPLAAYRDDQLTVIVGARNGGQSLAKLIGRLQGELGLSRASMGVPELFALVTGEGGAYDCLSYLLGDDGLKLQGARPFYSDVADLLNKGILVVDPEDLIDIVEEKPGGRVGLVLSDRSILWADRTILATGVKSNATRLIEGLLPPGTDPDTPIEKLGCIKEVRGTLPDGSERVLARQLFIRAPSGEEVPAPIYFAGVTGGSVADEDEVAGVPGNQQSLALFLKRLPTLIQMIATSSVPPPPETSPRYLPVDAQELTLEKGTSSRSSRPGRIRLPAAEGEERAEVDWLSRPAAMMPHPEIRLEASLAWALSPLSVSPELSKAVSHRLPLRVSQGSDDQGRWLELSCPFLGEEHMQRILDAIEQAPAMGGLTLVDRLREQTRHHAVEIGLPLVHEQDSSPARAEAIRYLFEAEREEGAPEGWADELEAALAGVRPDTVDWAAVDNSWRGLHGGCPSPRYRYVTSQGVVILPDLESPTPTEVRLERLPKVEIDRLRRRWGGSTPARVLNDLSSAGRLALSFSQYTVNPQLARQSFEEALLALDPAQLPSTCSHFSTYLRRILREGIERVQRGEPSEHAALLASNEFLLLSESAENVTDFEMISRWASKAFDYLEKLIAREGDARETFPAASRLAANLSHLIHLNLGEGRLTSSFDELSSALELALRGGRSQLEPDFFNRALADLRRLCDLLTPPEGSVLTWEKLFRAEKAEIDFQLRRRQDGRGVPGLAGDAIPERALLALNRLSSSLRAQAINPTREPGELLASSPILGFIAYLRLQLLSLNPNLAAFYKNASARLDAETIALFGAQASDSSRMMAIGHLEAELGLLAQDYRETTDLTLASAGLSLALDRVRRADQLQLRDLGDRLQLINDLACASRAVAIVREVVDAVGTPAAQRLSSVLSKISAGLDSAAKLGAIERQGTPVVQLQAELSLIEIDRAFQAARVEDERAHLTSTTDALAYAADYSGLEG